MILKDLRTPAMAVMLALALLPFLTSIGNLGGNVAAQQVEVEPNSDMAMAQEISPAIFYTGALDINSDTQDWFKIFVPRGKVLNVTVHMSVGQINADLEIFYPYIDGSFERKWSLTDYDYETICIVSVADQFYYILVFAISGSGQYTLDAHITEAQVLTPGKAVASGTLYNNSYNVIDFYKVWLENRGDETDLLEVQMNKTPTGGAEVAWLNLRIMKLYDWNVRIRWYDISWEDPDHEYARAAATETGWYYIRINAYNGSGDYELDLTISTVATDGNDRMSDAPILYGPGTKASGSLNQALDHKDCFALYLRQGEALDVNMVLNFPFTSPGIFAISILKPDGTLIGEWTNFNSSSLDTVIRASIDAALIQGRYTIIVEAKVGVNSSNHQDLTQEDALANYTLTITPSGHNSRPMAIDEPQKVVLDEDTPTTFRLDDKFTDLDIAEGDRLQYVVYPIDQLSISGPEIESGAVNVTINGSMAEISPVAEWSGAGMFHITALDLFDSTALISIHYQVHPINDLPTTAVDVLNVTLQEGVEIRPVDLDDIFSDVDRPYGDTLTYTLEGNDNLPSWIDSEGNLVLGPVTGMGQEEWFTVKATDEAGESVTIKVLVEVEKADHAPVAISSVPLIIGLDEDTTTSIQLYDLFSDPDPEDARLSLIWTGNSNILPLLSDDGTMTISARTDWSGTENITVKAIDHTGLSASVVLKVRVDPVGDAPVIVEASPEQGSQVQFDGIGFSMISVSVEDRDPGDMFTYSWYLNGDIMPRPPGSRGHLLTIDETLLTNGTHVLNLTVRDGFGLMAEATWELEVSRPAPEPFVRGPTPNETYVTGGLAFGLWAILLLFFTEPGRFGIFKFLWLPLYTKIKKEEVLDQFIRGRIYGYIEHNPGVNYTQIKKRMGVGNGTLTHHLSMLEKKSFIKAERDGIYKRFYPKNYIIDEESFELSAIQKDIFYLAKTTPGISQKEVASELGVSKRVISYHVRLLVEARLIASEKRGRRNSLTVIEES